MLVSLQAVARRDDAEEPITLLTSGRLTLEDGRSVLTYEEVLDEALPPQPVTVTLEDDTLMMERGGDYATQMIFRRGQRYEGQYDTPFGSMDLALFCTRLKAQLDESSAITETKFSAAVEGDFLLVVLQAECLEQIGKPVQVQQAEESN